MRIASRCASVGDALQPTRIAVIDWVVMDVGVEVDVAFVPYRIGLQGLGPLTAIGHGEAGFSEASPGLKGLSAVAVTRRGRIFP